tara:strand:+ start:182 stop:835 length:654 start_codon:yes stop_codon:yes gene_type:complete
MKVLIACEYSGAVRDAFIKKGHDAMSCDLLPTDVEGPHYQGSVTDILHDGWDLMIAHPPCTYLAVSGNRWLYNKDGSRNEERWTNRIDALDFVRLLMDAPIERIAVENPVSVISSEIRKPDQIIQPWQFGDEAQKTTCLWLKNLHKLKPTKIVGKGEFVTFKSGKKHPAWYAEAFAKAKTKAERQKLRSKTFQGIADAMAEQWGVGCKQENKQLELI